MIDKKHIQELEKVAAEIYDLAAEKISAYINETYGNNTDDTEVQQLQDFLIIADEVSAYLMGNAMALAEPEFDEGNIAELNSHIAQVTDYVRREQIEQKRPLN